ncbi:MAG: STAS domain-containing protein [Spirochaetota bacterium]
MISVNTDKEFLITILEETISNNNAVTILKDLKNAVSIKPDKKIIIDLAKVKYLDSAGIAMLVNFVQFMEGSQKKMSLINLTSKVKDTIKVLNLNKFFNLE